DNVIYTDYRDDGTQAGRSGEIHLINLDVGIWASDRSGGVTARSRAKQILQNCLGGARGIEKLRDFSDGDDGQLEIMSFTGGRFVPRPINERASPRCSALR